MTYFKMQVYFFTICEINNIRKSFQIEVNKLYDQS
jgi:hypothetical protein